MFLDCQWGVMVREDGLCLFLIRGDLLWDWSSLFVSVSVDEEVGRSVGFWLVSLLMLLSWIERAV